MQFLEISRVFEILGFSKILGFFQRFFGIFDEVYEDFQSNLPFEEMNKMAHSFDVFDAAGTHACSCQSNGGLASNCSKMHCKINIGATKSCIFIILIYFSIKPPESGKIQDLVARISISQHILL
jgi:hypothetical protein